MLTPRQLLPPPARPACAASRLAADVDDEMRFHIEMQTDALVRQGMSPGRARAKAESDFGAVSRVTDDVREARGLSAVERRRRSRARRALRARGRSPDRRRSRSSPSLTLTLGIGATTAMFSVVNGVLLSALPYPNADRLVELQRARACSRNRRTRQPSRRRTSSTGTRSRSTIELHDAPFAAARRRCSASPSRCKANLYAVSHDYFRLFGGTPLLGRTFSADESARRAASRSVS